MSIIVAGAAFIVSLASLYLTSLRRAVIDLHRVEVGHELPHRTWSNGMPTDNRIVLGLFVANTGAHGAVLEGVEVAGFRYRGTSPVLWSGVGTTNLEREPGSGRKFQLPTVLEAGDGEMLYVVTSLIRDGWGPRDESAIPFARRLAGFAGVSVELVWVYRRAASPLRQLWPWGDRSGLKWERISVDVDGRPYRDAALTFWAGKPPFRELLGVPEDPSTEWSGPPEPDRAASG